MALTVVSTLPIAAKAQTPPFTIETATPYQEVITPGNAITIKHKFNVQGSTSTSYKLFVHVIDANGSIKLQGDHFPPTPTTAWTNSNQSPIPDVTWTQALSIPSNFALGDYRIVTGLYNTSTGSRLALSLGSYVTELSSGSKSYITSNLQVTNRSVIRPALNCVDHIAIPDPANWPDQTATLQASLNAAALPSGTSSSPGPILKLPAGGCRFGSPTSGNGTLHLAARKYVDIVGSGIPDTILASTNPDATALVIDRSGNSFSSNILVRDITIRLKPPENHVRKYPWNSNGIYVTHADNVSIRRVRIEKVAAAGVVFYNSTNNKAQYNEIFENLADGIRVAGELSDQTIFEFNRAYGTGDDSYSSIGEDGNGVIVKNTTITNNYSHNSRASGIAIEGTNGAVARWNTIIDSGVAGIRIASIAGATFSSNATTNVNASDNYLQGVRTRCDTDHAAIMIFASHQNVASITASNNTISNPRSADGIRVHGGALSNTPIVNGASLLNNVFTANGLNPPLASENCYTTNTNLTQCFNVQPSNTTNVIGSGTMNGASCSYP